MHLEWLKFLKEREGSGDAHQMIEWKVGWKAGKRRLSKITVSKENGSADLPLLL